MNNIFTYTEKFLNTFIRKYSHCSIDTGGVLPPIETKPSKLPCAILDGIDKKHYVKRDNDVRGVNESLSEKKIVNVVGIGGCGKSTISILYLQNPEYRKQFTHITDIIINGDVYHDFCERYVEKHHICPWVYSIKEVKQHDEVNTFMSIVKLLSDYAAEPGKANLFILDVNETADENDYAKVRHAISVFEKYFVEKNWKLLVLSRIPLCDRLASTHDKNGYIDISRCDIIDYHFIKELFFFTLCEKNKHYQTFVEDDLKIIFKKLGNLPILINALAEYLKEEDYLLDASDIMKILGDGDLSDDLKGLDCTSINKEKVYDKIGNFLSNLCVFNKLETEMQKQIVRHMMLWDADYYNVENIRRLIMGTEGRTIEFSNSLHALERKCWLDSRQHEGKKQYKMHSLIATNCKKQINEKQLTKYRGEEKIEEPNPYYEANEPYRDYSSYIENVRGIISTNDSVDADIYNCLKSFDRIYYSWLDTQPYYSNNILENQCNDPIINKYINPDNFKKVPHGTFLRKGRKVTITNDFYIGVTQVMQELWDAVMKEYGFSNPSYFTPEKKEIKSKRITDTSRFPVESVSWYDCLAFIMNLNNLTHLRFRLPTEAEWEYAAGWRKDGGRNAFSGTNDERELSKYAWYDEAWDNGTTHTVATKHPNDLGIYDMSGNVWEWCQDLYDSSGASRVLRGGSWDDDAGSCQVSGRSSIAPGRRDCYNGFRLLLSSPKE